jgi:arginase
LQITLDFEERSPSEDDKPMSKRRIVVLDAPSNLGLRPPEAGAVPGCYKLPWALRDRKLLQAIEATDAGVIIPPRYRAEWQPGQGDRNADAIALFSIALADRVHALVEQQAFALILGGDCSILIGNTLALKRGGRYGLVFLDAHSDFRHLENAPAIGAAAGEDLAIVTGRGDRRLINLENRGPYVQIPDSIIIGVRPNDECLDELTGLGMKVITSTELAQLGPQQAALQALETVTGATQGFWIHLDVDVVDSSEMPAVDSPEPDGVPFRMLTELLTQLVASPYCAGLEVTIYDPDLDPTGAYADQLRQCLSDALRGESQPSAMDR